MLNLIERYEDSQITRDQDGLQITRVFLADTADVVKIVKQIGNQCNIPLSIGDKHPMISNAVLHRISPKYISSSKDKSLVTAFYKTTLAIDPTTPGENSKSYLANTHGEIWEFNLSSQHTHITSVAKEINQINFGIDVGTAINVTSTGVKGIDVYRPTIRIRVTKHITDADLAVALSIINNQNSTVNNQAWLGAEYATVLFIGAEIKKVNVNDWSIVYNFLMGNTQLIEPIVLSEEYTKPDGTVVPEVVTPEVTVYPWQYIWYQFRKNTKSGDIKYNIKSFHIAQVYPFSDFSNFGLHDPGENNV